ncbi:PAS domain S-box protein [Nostoc sp. TCL26-01]|uniref:PAS domain S-box protein n=1 Tax=Nostoc sp. TCL26-01 TaxID=2576904 RepID=UPI0015B907BE|nr:PAS domain S-box protein [Nostoc sp. TCL26-01]QLE59311.1 PAS domain S-box protein [Nostoc sp. TCL26-01]
MKFSVIHKLRILFILALAVLLTNAGVCYSHTMKLFHNQQWMTSSHTVITQIETILTTFQDTEINQQNYLLTKNLDALKDYKTSSQSTLDNIQRLRQITINQNLSHKWIFLLEQKIRARFAQLTQEFSLSQNPSFTAQPRPEIPQLISERLTNERNSLQELIQQSQISYQKTLTTFSLAVFVNVLLLFFLYKLLQRYIVKLQQTETTLRQNEHRLRAIFDAELGCIQLIARDGTLLEINASGLAMMEVESTEAVIGKSINWVIAPEYQQAFAALHQSVCQGNKETLEYEIVGFKGTRRWWETHAVPIVDESDGTFLHLAVARDITKRKQAEQKIREQRVLLDVATDAILVRNIHNQILFWNKGAERLYGWKMEEALGKNVGELLHHINSPQQQEALLTVIDKGEWQGELHQLTKDEQKVIVESRWKLVKDKDGQPKSILSVNTEITSKKQLEAQLLRSQRLESIGTMASGIAHDLNNILAPILMSVQLLQMKLHDPQMQKVLNTLENNVKRGANLLKQVLSFARGIEGKKTIVQIRQLLIEVEQIVQQTFPKSIICHTNIPENLWHVSGDTTQLHQVLMNLVLNARDAMPHGGTLNISAENVVLAPEGGAYIVIYVEDTGLGIPSKIQQQIFEPFFSTKDIGKGTGLGLSTALSIINNHGGFINVKSEESQGTQFQVYLPALLSNTQLVNSEETELLTGNGEEILVVDDEAIIREITKSSLEAYNYRVLTASDGEEAISIYTQYQQKISVVLLDMMMPTMDGAIAIRQLKNINPDVKIIAISGLLSEPDAGVILSMGVKAFLSKPCTAKELAQTINAVNVSG